MPTTSSPRRYSLAIAGAVLVGLVFLVANVRGSPLRSGTVEFAVVFVLPLPVALLAYRRFAASAARWELAALTAWGVLSLFFVAFGVFLATMDVATGYLGLELLRNVVLFATVTAGLAVPYGLAAAVRRDHPWGAAVGVLLAPLVLLVLFSVVSLVV